ncbi:MAG: 3-deoxy-D-manno-octulosonic acid transferase [Pseudomonadota bacterium]
MTARFSPALSLYLAATHALAPLAPMILWRRKRQGREDGARLGERLGHAALPRPQGRLVWLHGASLGETASMAPLIAALRAVADPPELLITAGTVTAAERLRQTLPPGARHQYVPVDTAPAVRHFLSHWRPDLAIWVESEFWPGLMVRTARAGVPMMLINARLSAASARGWARLPAMAARLVGLFDRILTQDEATLERLAALGRPRDAMRHAGNLKAAIPPPACDPAELRTLRDGLAGRPIWLAASTHPGEDAAVIEAHLSLKERLPGLVTILAPRHPERGAAIVADARARTGLPPAQRSRGDGPPADGGIWLADSLGEMGLWYRLAPVSFIAGSIAPLGGHNPFEAAALGTAILHGPRTENFAPAYAALDAAEGGRHVSDATSLAAALGDLLAADGARHPRAVAMATRGREALTALAPDVDAIAAEALSLMATRAGGRP